MSWEFYDAHPVEDKGYRWIVVVAFSVLVLLAVFGFAA